ncbi:MAG: hypothetical protein ACO237_04930, partial [Candidatus Limnocylindrus sp.]
MGKASRKKQDLYRGVDGEGRPLFPADEPTRSSLAGVPISWLVAVVAGGLGYLVFRNRIKGVYFSILTQA